MELLFGSDGSIVPVTSEQLTDDQLANTYLAMDLYKHNAERMGHFKQKVEALGRSGADTVITLLNVDDPVGKVLADIVMPGHDWQKFRDAGETPVARGMVTKGAIPEFLTHYGYTKTADELAMTDELKVLVISSGVALVLDVVE